MIGTLFATITLAGPQEDHWAWKQPVRPSVPSVKGPQPGSAIDLYLSARLRKLAHVLRSPASETQTAHSPGQFRPSWSAANAGVKWTLLLPRQIAERVEKWFDGLLASSHCGAAGPALASDSCATPIRTGSEFDEPRPDARATAIT